MLRHVYDVYKWVHISGNKKGGNIKNLEILIWNINEGGNNGISR